VPRARGALDYTAVRPRIWILLLAVLLLAAPADSAFEIADASATTSLCDDEAVTDVPVVLAETVAARITRPPRRDDATPPAPALARIFRPPRRSFD
jgi:hypothetical protein